MLQSIPHLSLLLTLRAAFLKHGRDIRLVGGVVRNILSGTAPDDIDLATDATPEEQKKIYESENIHHVPTGLSHGTWLVVFDDTDEPITFEVTSLRIDTNPDGRHAKVVYIRDWLLDLSRRDLTINAISLTFDGELIDPYNGVNDLASKRVVFVGKAEERIHEDYLRILRWFRFSARYSQKLDETTLEIVKKTGSGLLKISRERVWSEISKIISGPNGDHMMYEIVHSIGRYIDLEFENIPNITHPIFIGHTLTKNPVYLMKYFCIDQDKLDLLAQKWKWSNEEKRQAKLFDSVMDVSSLSDAKKRIILGIDRNEMIEMMLAWGYGHIAVDLARWTVPNMPFTANDILASGIPEGPEVGRKFRTLRNRWIESDYTLTKEELFT